MAPPKQHTVDRTDEWDKFIEELQDFHADRGTKFDPIPKVTQVSVDLLKLYKYVVSKGGYDALAVEKNIWLSVAQDLGIGSKTGVAFNLKTAYYKNLVAYEIKTLHNKTPPPKEILEDVSAAGGNILNRTLENYIPKKANASAPGSREASNDVGTPARDTKAEEGGTPSSSRAARGLRSAPPQRVMFQPDTGPGRASSFNRSASGQQHASPSASQSNSDQSLPNMPSKMDSHAQSNGHPQSHAAGRNPSHQMNSYASSAHVSQPYVPRGGASASFQPADLDFQSATVTSYQPPAVQALTLRPIETPANSPAKFAKRPLMTVPAAPRQAPLPGSLNIQPSPFDGPNIYARCLYALRSTVPSEEAFAVHHLMKISYERGDRYKFEGFPGLAEGLVNIAVRVGELFYDVKWTVCYDPESDGADPAELDGVNGTADILDRIAQLRPLPAHLHIQPAIFADKMTLVTEAAMTFRNMVMLTENSETMALFPPLTDLICILLHLPTSDETVELKHIALDIAEQLTPYLVLDSHDPLYQTLLKQLYSVDRGEILTSLRALTRTSMNRPQSNKLADVPLDILAKVVDWLMLNDEEMLDASLDFLYQYTAIVPNLETLLRFRFTTPGKPYSLVKNLARLLSHGAKSVTYKQTIKPEEKIPFSEEVATLPHDLQERLLFMEEPERCYAWLRSLFEEDPDASITQIAIWTAYQASFSSRVSLMGKQMISPADFIRNVNHVWTTAGAQIIRSPKGDTQKFIIKGIRARSRPVDPHDGTEYFRCLWTLPGPKIYQKCNLFFANAEKMFYHILDLHMYAKLIQAPPQNRKYMNEEISGQCFWAGCSKFSQPTKMPIAQLMAHVKTHLIAVQQLFEPAKPLAVAVTNDGEASADGASVNSPSPIAKRAVKRSNTIPAKSFTITNEETAATRDERNPNLLQPAGIPLSAILVLRNIARNVVKTEAQEELLKDQEKMGVGETARGWNEKLFREVLPRLFEVMTVNRVMAPNVASLLDLIEAQ
ncbi:unnamed protein product [Discula destructiva]